MQFTRTIQIAAPRERVWELLADTERFNREIGLPPIQYHFFPRAAGGAELFGTMQMGRWTMRYRELPFEWVRPDYYSVRRIFERGPILEFYTHIAFAEAESGTAVRCQVELTPRSPVIGPLVSAVGRKMLSDTLAIWRSFEQFLMGQAQTPYPRHSSSVPINRERLERCVTTLQSLQADPALMQQLAHYLTHSPPEDVTMLRPFELADRWSTDRMAVLQTCLLAVRAQLLEMRWRPLCPMCRSSAPENVARRLRDLRSDVHCPSCNIRFDAEFDRSVEVCFAVAPRVRDVREILYCRGGPVLSPHVCAQLALQPGESRSLSLSLPVGRYALVSPQASASINLRIAAEVCEKGTAVTRTPCAFLETEGQAILLKLMEEAVCDKADWTFSNRTQETITLRIEEQESHSQAATAALVTSLQTFRDGFSSEALAPETELAVRQICVLFSDLKGSTAMYRERGDAPSYRTVRDYFHAMRHLIARHEGGIVKTIGDCVMATFCDPAHGLAAALAIQRAAQEWPDGLVVKLGLHSGPALAVNANDLLDYFGQTINLASRLQSESQGGDIVIANEMLADSQVSTLLQEHGCRLESFARTLRGFDAPCEIVRITLP